jgi:hypothetical protein
MKNGENDWICCQCHGIRLSVHVRIRACFRQVLGYGVTSVILYQWCDLWPHMTCRGELQGGAEAIVY